MITLEQIEAKQTELADLIEKFKTQPKPIQYGIPAVVINLAPGERYAGLVLNDDGTASHHLVLLPGDEVGLTWPAAKARAIEQGGQLPSRREQALLYANLPGEFEATWYWSSTVYSEASAWYQYFGHGGQVYGHQSNELRARAVRRLTV